MDSTLILLSIAIVLLLVSILAFLLIRQNKEGMYPNQTEAGKKAMGKGIAIGYAIGMGPGIAIGVALENIVMGIAIGTGMGISMGFAIGASLKKKADEKAGARQKEMPGNEMLPKIIGLIIALAGLLVLGFYFFYKMK